jgi:hypothetical protein
MLINIWLTYDEIDLRPVCQNGSRSLVDDQLYEISDNKLKLYNAEVWEEREFNRGTWELNREQG